MLHDTEFEQHNLHFSSNQWFRGSSKRYPKRPSIIRLLIKRCFFPVIIDFRVLWKSVLMRHDVKGMKEEREKYNKKMRRKSRGCIMTVATDIYVR